MLSSGEKNAGTIPNGATPVSECTARSRLRLSTPSWTKIADPTPELSGVGGNLTGSGYVSEGRQSLRTVETSVVVMLNGWLILWGPRAGWGRRGLPACAA